MFARSKPPLPQDHQLEDIVARAKKGDTDAFGQIYQHLLEPIYRYVYYRVNTKETAQDLTQEVFMKAYSKLHQFHKGSFTAWIYAIARNRVIDHYRTQKDHRSLNDLPANLEPHHQSNTNKHLNNITIKRCLRQLPDRYQEVIILRYLEDLSVAQTAQVMDISAANVRTLSHRALDQLKSINQSKE